MNVVTRRLSLPVTALVALLFATPALMAKDQMRPGPSDGFGVGNGGDAVICEKVPTNAYAGYYALD